MTFQTIKIRRCRRCKKEISHKDKRIPFCESCRCIGKNEQKYKTKHSHAGHRYYLMHKQKIKKKNHRNYLRRIEKDPTYYRRRSQKSPSES